MNISKDSKLYGIVLSLLIAVPSWFIGKLLPVVGGPVFAIIIGMVAAVFIKSKDLGQNVCFSPFFLPLCAFTTSLFSVYQMA